jgi:hypothetical protein
MLFDLRGRGRRNTVKAIYVFLAFLMGGGLVFFGIGGGANSNGGLLDALTGGGASKSDIQKRFENQERTALAQLRANPKNEAAYITLIRARYQLASVGDRFNADQGTYTDAGKAELRLATGAWEKYEALNPKNTDEESRIASLMVQAYVSLNQLEPAARAQEVIATARNTSGAYSQLAVLSYEAGLTRKGDLAAKKALGLTDKDLRQSLKAQLDAAKQQAVQQQVQQAIGTPTPSVGG